MASKVVAKDNATGVGIKVRAHHVGFADEHAHYVERDPAAAVAIANVAASTSSVTLQAANNARRGLIVYNDSESILYLKYTSGASSTSFTVRIEPFQAWVMPEPVFTGLVAGIWVTATGAARMTELT